MKEISAVSESIIVGFILSICGGFLDIYTYIYRGGVFANAVTGNVVLLGFHIATEKWVGCAKYLLSVSFYAFGIFIAEGIRHNLKKQQILHWQQGVLLVELMLLIPICFVPYGDLDYVVNSLVALICATQVQAFRKVKALPFASTMCTGNLRLCAEKLFYAAALKDKTALRDGIYYILMILGFILGAIIGALALNAFGHFAFLVVPALILIVFLIITFF